MVQVLCQLRYVYFGLSYNLELNTYIVARGSILGGKTTIDRFLKKLVN